MARIVAAPAGVGVRAPVRLQGGPFGVVNRSAGGRVPPPVGLIARGPSTTREQFGGDDGIPANVARALNQVQANAAKAAAEAADLPFEDGNLIENWPVVVGNGSGSGGGLAPYNVIQHGLGMPYRGAMVLSTRGGYLSNWCIIPNSSSALDSAQIQLWMTGNAFTGKTLTADIWVYA